MTEIPDHLLERTRAARQRLGIVLPGTEGAGDAGGGDATPAAAAGGGGAVEAAAETLPKGPVAPATPAVRAPEAPKPVAPFVEAYHRRKKIPVWALPVAAFMPFWAFIYAGTLEPAPSNELGTVEEGELVYGSCAVCHGASGGGGVGPALSGGAVLTTFESPAGHMEWVITGSDGAEGSTYGDTNKPIQGGMPGFRDSLSMEELYAVIRHEREALSGEEFDPVGYLEAVEALGEAYEYDPVEVEETLLLIEEDALEEGIDLEGGEEDTEGEEGTEGE